MLLVSLILFLLYELTGLRPAATHTVKGRPPILSCVAKAGVIVAAGHVATDNLTVFTVRAYPIFGIELRQLSLLYVAP
jgi:hypothetical protein